MCNVLSECPHLTLEKYLRRVSLHLLQGSGRRRWRGKDDAQLYAEHATAPPTSLITTMLNFLKEKYTGPLNLAYDVGCGNGASTTFLSPHFTRVVGTDVCPTQISRAWEEAGRAGEDCSSSQMDIAECGGGAGGWGWATESLGLDYRVSPAEVIPETNNSVQMISASQAAHWFDLPKFYDEARRVLSPRGVLCLYGYHYPKLRWELDPSKNCGLDDAIDQLYGVDLAGYWAAERKIVDSGYLEMTIPSPYSDFVRDNSCYSDMRTSVADMANHVVHWSGHQNFVAARGEEEGQKLICNLEERVMSALNVTTSPEETMLTKRTQFFLLMARK